MHVMQPETNQSTSLNFSWFTRASTFPALFLWWQAERGVSAQSRHTIERRPAAMLSLQCAKFPSPPPTR